MVVVVHSKEIRQAELLTLFLHVWVFCVKLGFDQISQEEALTWAAFAVDSTIVAAARRSISSCWSFLH